MQIIGISGDKGAGKDSTADVLVNEFGFHSLAPGDLIRESLHLIFGIPIEEMVNRETKEKYRKLQQDYGMMVRKLANDDLVWIKAVARRAQDNNWDKLVIPSVRGEESYVESLGGESWFVTRPGLVKDENDGHDIEQFAANANPDDYAHHIINNSSMEALASKVRGAFLA